MKKFKCTHELLEAVNSVKDSFEIRENGFNFEALKQALINCGLTKSNTYWMIFKKSGLLKNIGNNCYVFTHGKNWHFTEQTMEGLWHKYSIKIREYNSNSYQKSKTPSILTEEETIEQAIQILKAQGYKIYKPELSYTEI